MAIRLSGSISRKVPIDGVPFSSQSFSCGMDLEVSNPSEVQSKLAELYVSLNQALDAQIAGTTQAPISTQNGHIITQGNAAPTQSYPVQTPTLQPVPAPQRVGYANGRNRLPAATNGNGANGNGRRITCTEAQAKCIYAICKSQGLDLISVLADFNVADARDLHVKDASRLIDQLKAQQNGNGTAA